MHTNTTTEKANAEVSKFADHHVLAMSLGKALNEFWRVMDAPPPPATPIVDEEWEMAFEEAFEDEIGEMHEAYLNDAMHLAYCD